MSVPTPAEYLPQYGVQTGQWFCFVSAWFATSQSTASPLHNVFILTTTGLVAFSLLSSFAASTPLPPLLDSIRTSTLRTDIVSH